MIKLNLLVCRNHNFNLKTVVNNYHIICYGDTLLFENRGYIDNNWWLIVLLWYLAENERENISFSKYQLLRELIKHSFFINYRLIVLFLYYLFKK